MQLCFLDLYSFPVQVSCTGSVMNVGKIPFNIKAFSWPVDK